MPTGQEKVAEEFIDELLAIDRAVPGRIIFDVFLYVPFKDAKSSPEKLDKWSTFAMPLDFKGHIGTDDRIDAGNTLVSGISQA